MIKRNSPPQRAGPYAFTCMDCNEPSILDLTEEDLQRGLTDGSLKCWDCYVLETFEITDDAEESTERAHEAEEEAETAEDSLAAMARLYYSTFPEALN